MDEIIEEPTPAPAPEGGMFLTHFALYDLGRAAKWAKFIAIVGFVLSAFVVIMAFGMSTMFSQMGSISPYGAIAAGMGVFATIMYLIIAAVSFIIYLFLYQFATRATTAIATNNTAEMERSMHRLQSFFKAIGILLIAYLCLLVLGFLFIVAVGVGMHH